MGKHSLSLSRVGDGGGGGPTPLYGLHNRVDLFSRSRIRGRRKCSSIHHNRIPLSEKHKKGLGENNEQNCAQTPLSLPFVSGRGGNNEILSLPFYAVFIHYISQILTLLTKLLLVGSTFQFLVLSSGSAVDPVVSYCITRGYLFPPSGLGHNILSCSVRNTKRARDENEIGSKRAVIMR